MTFGLIFKLGFNLSEQIESILFFGTLAVSFIFIAQEVYRFTLYRTKLIYLKERWFDVSLVIGCGIFLLTFFGLTWFSFTETEMNTGLSLLILFGLFTSLTSKVESRVSQSRLSLRPAQVFLISFMAPIFIGTLLLKMPNSTTFELSWVDALFMATSAVCVTGLATVDLTQFTFLGQVIMALLIQIGGLGIMTLTLAFSSLIAGGLGVKERIMIGKMFSENKLSEVKGLLYKICLYTFAIELTGVGLLYFSLKKSLVEPNLNDLWVSVFHSISAFCNAGFSILEAGLTNQLVQANYFFCSVIMILIVLGGIGFPTLANLQQLVIKSLRKDRDSHLLSTTTKVVLSATLVLLVVGTISLYLTETGNLLVSQHWFDRWFQSLFWSVTARTAGFNTLPVEELSLMSVLVLILLMWIGGAPMSTAGGIKVTTFYLAFLNLKSQIFSLDRIEAFGRQIKSESVIRAFGIMTLSLVFIFLSSFVLVALNPKLDTFDLLFEVVSAVSTVGLSRGITASLDDFSKIILVLLMFIGRVGLVTVFAAFVKPAVIARYQYLEDDIIV